MNLKRSAIRHSKDRSQKTQLTWLPAQSSGTNGIFRVCRSHMSSLVCPADARLVVHLVKVVWGWDQPCCTLGSHYFSFPMLTPQGSVLSLDLWSPSSIPRETQVINRALLDRSKTPGFFRLLNRHSQLCWAHHPLPGLPCALLPGGHI